MNKRSYESNLEEACKLLAEKMEQVIASGEYHDPLKPITEAEIIRLAEDDPEKFMQFIAEVFFGVVLH